MDDAGSSAFASLRTQIQLFAYVHLSQRRGWKAFHQDKWQKEIDIERLLTLAEANVGLWDVISSPDDSTSTALGRVGRNLAEYFKRSVAAFIYADTVIPQLSWAPIVAFCDQLRPTDTVITFNWDTLVERVLEALRRPFVLSRESSKRISVLKLHGSIDWISGKPPNKKAAALTTPVNRHIARVNNYPQFNDAAGDWFVPYLVPPTAYKRYEPGILGLWKVANSALFNASQVIIVGYSMPVTDWTSVSLLRLPFRPEIRDGTGKRPCKKELIVINPAQEVAERFRAIVSPSCAWVAKRTEHVEWGSLRADATSVLR